MCAQITTENPAAVVHGRGVNATGLEASNAAATSGRVLPWLQDDAPTDAWGLWAVLQRDCIVIDRFERVFAIYNLTSHDLANPTFYAELKALILAAHAAPP